MAASPIAAYRLKEIPLKTLFIAMLGLLALALPAQAANRGTRPFEVSSTVDKTQAPRDGVVTYTTAMTNNADDPVMLSKIQIVYPLSVNYVYATTGGNWGSDPTVRITQRAGKATWGGLFD